MNANGSDPVEQYECGSWEAVLDHMPPGKTIRVSGTCTFPTPGYEGELRPRQPGINPEDLLLDLFVRPPDTPVPAVPEDKEFRYESETGIDYKTATVLGYASVNVQHVR